MSEWISVKDRLPELDKTWGENGVTIGHYAEVLIFEDGKVCSGSYDKLDSETGGSWTSGDGCRAGRVTHWMPLPEGPKESA